MYPRRLHEKYLRLMELIAIYFDDLEAEIRAQFFCKVISEAVLIVLSDDSKVDK